MVCCGTYRAPPPLHRSCFKLSHKPTPPPRTTHTHTQTHTCRSFKHTSRSMEDQVSPPSWTFLRRPRAPIGCRQVRSVVRNTEVSTVPLVSLPRCELQGHCTSDASSAAGATCSGRSMHGESGRGGNFPSSFSLFGASCKPMRMKKLQVANEKASQVLKLAISAQRGKEKKNLFYTSGVVIVKILFSLAAIAKSKASVVRCCNFLIHLLSPDWVWSGKMPLLYRFLRLADMPLALHLRFSAALPW